jgi:uncharacterized Zn-binding protein involved in type VI secretion
LQIIPPGSPDILIDNLAAARVTDLSEICNLPTCVPNGPGMIQMGSTTVLFNNLQAARMGDPTAHNTCMAPIPSPTGKIMPPCSPTVMIGG